MEYEYYEMLVKWGILLLVLFIVVFLLIPLFIVAEIADKKGRSSTLWVIYSIIVSPYLSMYILHILGETNDKREERIVEEEKLKNLYRSLNSGNTENNFENWIKENPGKSANDYYNKR